MKTYRIENTTSGVDLGTYEGETPEDALREMYRDSGYPSGTPEGTGMKFWPDDLVVTEVECQHNIIRNRYGYSARCSICGMTDEDA